MGISINDKIVMWLFDIFKKLRKGKCMNLAGMQWLYAILIGLIIGWVLPAAMSEKTIMPYGKAITWGIVGALIGAVIYGLANDAPTNGMVVLWSIIGSLVCYFIVRAVNNKNNTNNTRAQV